MSEQRRPTLGPLAVASMIGAACGVALSLALHVRVSEKQLSGLEWGAPPPPAARPAPDALPPLALRLVDAGGVGIPADSTRWGASYSHATDFLDGMMLDGPPWVDAHELGRVRDAWRRYLGRMAGWGNNAVVLDGFLQIVRFERLGNGHAVYPDGDLAADRRLAVRGAYAELVSGARAAGMAPFLKTDMPALTPELEAYLRRRLGGLDTADPAFWAVYASGMEELFDALPALEGVVVRVGEAGPLFHDPGSDVRSYFGVREPRELRAMLEELLPVFERRGKKLILRSWSIGVGALGHLHDDPDVYRAALGGIDSPALIVSTKFVAGDYFGFLPLNPTLRVGTQKRLVEMQARREFEGFGALPNYLAQTHRRALLELRAENPNIVGMQLWTQEGGPLRAGPLSLYTVAGFWRWTDANVYATSQLARDPTADPHALAEQWARTTISDDPDVAKGMADLLMRSREALEKAIYIRPYAERRVDMMGMQAPPILWISEWDVLGGWSSVLATVYRAIDGRFEPSIEEGFEAARLARIMQADLAALEPELGDRADWPQMARSLAYQESLYGTLAWYRAEFLHYYRWLDRGGPETWRRDAQRFLAMAADHRARFGDDLDFPAFDFTPAEAAVRRSLEGGRATQAARVMLGVLLGVLLLGVAVAQRGTPEYPGKRWARTLTVGSSAPLRLAEDPHGRGGTTWLLALTVVVILALTAALTFMVDPLPVLAATAALIAAWVLTLRGAWSGFRGDAQLAPYAPASVGPLVLATIPVLATLAVRGPDYLWYRFWTGDGFRTLGLAVVATGVFWALASAHALGRRVGGGIRFATGSLLVSVGGALLVLTAMLPDVHATLAALDHPLNLLPMRPAIIHGITQYAGLRGAVLWLPDATGGALIVLGVLLGTLGRGGEAHGPAPEGQAATDGATPAGVAHSA